MEERIIAADPVEQPQEYTRELVALLGGHDPLDVLGATAARVRELTAGVPDEVLRRRPEPREWSVTEVLAHLVHAERGDTPLRLLVETAAGHDRAHVKQVEQTLAAVR